MTITDFDVKMQVLETIHHQETEFDVQGIVSEIISRFGPVDISTLYAEVYWEIVATHALPEGVTLAPAGAVVAGYPDDLSLAAGIVLIVTVAGEAVDSYTLREVQHYRSSLVESLHTGDVRLVILDSAWSAIELVILGPLRWRDFRSLGIFA